MELEDIEILLKTNWKNSEKNLERQRGLEEILFTRGDTEVGNLTAAVELCFKNNKMAEVQSEVFLKFSLMASEYSSHSDFEHFLVVKIDHWTIDI